jgi:GNAT superfamily N-acetyltransferase
MKIGKLRIRFAKIDDVEAIFRIGRKSNEFSVSNKIRFYEKDEIAKWVNERENNIVIVAESNSVIIAFAYCKLMSHHWALVDNFFVMPEFRKIGIGSKMEDFLEKELVKRKINYVSRLVKPDHRNSRKFLKVKGFKEHDKYIWIDKLLS